MGYFDKLYHSFDITVFAGHYMRHDDFHIHAVYCQSLRRERLSKNVTRLVI